MTDFVSATLKSANGDRWLGWAIEAELFELELGHLGLGLGLGKMAWVAWSEMAKLMVTLLS